MAFDRSILELPPRAESDRIAVLRLRVPLKMAPGRATSPRGVGERSAPNQQRKWAAYDKAAEPRDTTLALFQVDRV